MGYSSLITLDCLFMYPLSGYGFSFFQRMEKSEVELVREEGKEYLFLELEKTQMRTLRGRLSRRKHQVREPNGQIY